MKWAVTLCSGTTILPWTLQCMVVSVNMMFPFPRNVLVWPQGYLHKSEPSRAESSRVEQNQTGQTRAEPGRAEPSLAEAIRVEPN